MSLTPPAELILSVIIRMQIISELSQLEFKRNANNQLNLTRPLTRYPQHLAWGQGLQRPGLWFLIMEIMYKWKYNGNCPQIYSLNQCLDVLGQSFWCKQVILFNIPSNQMENGLIKHVSDLISDIFKFSVMAGVVWKITNLWLMFYDNTECMFPLTSSISCVNQVLMILMILETWDHPSSWHDQCHSSGAPVLSRDPRQCQLSPRAVCGQHHAEIWYNFCVNM